MTTVERNPLEWSHAGQGASGGALAQRSRALAGVVPTSVEVGDTIRLLVDTASTEVRAPDRGMKFRAGLVVLVDDVDFDAITARRWVRNKIAEPFPGGVPGDVVTAEERTADPDDLEAQIARLQQLRDRAKVLAAERQQATLDDVAHQSAREAVDRDPYRVPAEERPWRRLGLADQQIEALEHAGFTTQAQIDNATDDEILDIRGIGMPTLRKLRGRIE